MDVIEISKMLHGLNICVDINSHIGESKACMRRVIKTTGEGLEMARELINASIKMKDLKIMKQTYLLVKKLKPASDLMDSVRYTEIEQMYNDFYKDVVKTIKLHPRFVFRYLLVDMHNEKINSNSVEKRQTMDNNINIVYQQILMKRGERVRD